MKKTLLMLICLTCSCVYASRTLYSTADGYWNDPDVWITDGGAASTPKPDDHVVISHEIIQLVENNITYTHYGNVLVEVDGAYLINTGKGMPNAYIFAGSLFEVYGVLITSDDFSHQKGVPDGDGIFHAYEGATIFIGDDYEPHEKSLTINEVDCFVMGDDLKFFGDQSLVCGTGRMCIGPITNIPGTANGEVRAIIDGVHTSGFQFVCDGIDIFRIGPNGEICAEFVQTGTGEIPPLPVELISFEANIEAGTVVLNWLTASELNNDYFTLERGRNVEAFIEIGETPGAGTTNFMQEYRFVDANPLSGTTYYRLRQTDFDGKTTYSQIVEVRFVYGQASLSIYPNPIVDDVSLLLSGFKAHQSVWVKITDVTGRLVYRKQFYTDNEGVLDTMISPLLDIGNYILSCQSSTQYITQKIIRY